MEGGCTCTRIVDACSIVKASTLSSGDRQRSVCMLCMYALCVCMCMYVCMNWSQSLELQDIILHYITLQGSAKECMYASVISHFIRHLSLSLSTSIHIYIYIYIHTYMYVYVYMCICVVCISLSLSLSISLSLTIHIYIYIYICASCPFTRLANI